jgi:hypothetical protein
VYINEQVSNITRKVDDDGESKQPILWLFLSSDYEEKEKAHKMLQFKSHCVPLLCTMRDIDEYAIGFCTS